MKKIIFLQILIISILTSCSKYEDGPSLSLRSKKARLCGEWKIEFVSQDGIDITTDVLTALGSENEFHIEKDGTYHVHGLSEDMGTWELKDKKESLLTQSNTAGSEAEDFTILKLENDALWLKHVHEDGTFIYHYKQ